MTGRGRLAADQFVVGRGEPGPHGQPGGGHSLIAGYPWFNDWGRDTMISLTGLTLVTGRGRLAADILRTYAAVIREGLIPNLFEDPCGSVTNPRRYNSVDATLWFIKALRDYRRWTGDLSLIAELYPVLASIVDHHLAGTRHGIRVDPADGLLRAGDGEMQLTWMDACDQGRAVTPRHGKPIEVNALWIHALMTMEQFAAALGEDPHPYSRLACRARQGFQRFWSDGLGHCFDVLDGPGGRPDPSLRPNQLIALALPEPLLNDHQARQILRICSERLLTSHGLRSLDPLDPRYRGHYRGGWSERDRAYHQGTVWGWLLGSYALAHARVHGRPLAARRILEPTAHHLRTAGLGSISEIFDGAPPHHPGGCIAQAWSVGEVLRAWVELTLAAD